MENFVFERQDRSESKVILPDDYNRNESSILGFYTTNSIRFYKDKLDKIISYNEILKNYPNLSLREIRKISLYIYSCMAEFDIKDNKICLKGLNTVQDKYYDFSSGLVIVKNDSFMDIVEKSKIKLYLDNYGFDESKEVEILNNDVVILPRVTNKKLKYRLRK